MLHVLATTVDLKVLAGVLAALGIAAAAILKVFLDHRRALASPIPDQCPLRTKHLELLEELHAWHEPDDRGSGRQRWKQPAGQHEMIIKTRSELLELRAQLGRVENQLGAILEPYRPPRKDPTIP